MTNRLPARRTPRARPKEDMVVRLGQHVFFWLNISKYPTSYCPARREVTFYPCQYATSEQGEL